MDMEAKKPPRNPVHPACPDADTVVILAPGHIPTTDYYVTSRIGQGLPAKTACFDSRVMPKSSCTLEGAWVVIVRHASCACLEFLKTQRLAGVSYLMDDDIPAAWRCRDVPLDYGLWTSGRYWRIRAPLSALCDEVWVSTPELARRYPGTRLMPPLPFDAPASPAPVGCRRWGYHGSRIHARETEWIVPVVDAVQQVVPEAEFEVFGGERVKRLFRHVPRVTVYPPMPWPDYLAHCRANPLAVGVAPLLPGWFNTARAHTKAFDILRCGAAGVFSAREPYAQVLGKHGAVCLPDDRSAWVEAIIALLTDDAWRRTCFFRLAEWAAAQAATGPDLRGLLA